MTDTPEPTELVPDASQGDGQPADLPAETGDEVACVEAILFSSDSPLTPGRHVISARTRGKRLTGRSGSVELPIIPTVRTEVVFDSPRIFHVTTNSGPVTLPRKTAVGK